MKTRQHLLIKNVSILYFLETIEIAGSDRETERRRTLAAISNTTLGTDIQSLTSVSRLQTACPRVWALADSSPNPTESLCIDCGPIVSISYSERPRILPPVPNSHDSNPLSLFNTSAYPL